MATRQRVEGSPATPSRPRRGSSRDETVRLLLLQIYTRAEQQRVDKQQSRLRGAHIGPGSGSPLSLIELIQASGPLFERYGVGAPDDAVYHRYLLSLSIDPDPDWRRKVAALRLDSHPRVQRQHRARSTRLDSNGSTAPSPMAAFVEKDEARRRNRAGRNTRQQEYADLPRQRRRPSSESGDVQSDLFGNVLQGRSSLAFSKEQSPRALVRPVSPVRRSLLRVERSTTRSRSSDDGVAVAPSPFTRDMSVSRLLLLQGSTQRTRAGRLVESDHGVRDNSTDNDDNDPDGPGPTDREATSDDKWRADAFRSAVSDAQLLSTVFEQWKSMRDLRRLGDLRADQDVRMRRALMPNAAVAAVFRWIVLTLPEKYAVASHAVSRDLFIPTALARRIDVTKRSSVSDLSALNKFAQRLSMSRAKRLLASWRRRAGMIRELRRRCLVRQRVEALEVAFQCMLQWRLFAETRKCLVERSNWITLRYGRRVLREKIAHWRELLHDRQRDSWATEMHALERAASCWEQWRRLVRNRHNHRERCARFACKRAITRWKEHTHTRASIRDQNLTADGHFRCLLLSRGWRRWKEHLEAELMRRFKVERCRKAHDRRCKITILRGWRQALDIKYEMDALTAKFVKWRRLRLLRRWLIAWTSWVDVRLEVGEKLDGAALARARRLLVAVVHGWKTHHEDTLRLDAMKEGQIRTSERRRLWSKWRRLVAVRLVVVAFRRGYDGHVLSSHMSRWRAFSETATVWRAALSTAQHNHVHRVLTKCWQLLVQHVGEQRSKKRAAMRFLQQRHVTSELAAFRRWCTLLTVAKTRRAQEEHARVAVRRVFLLRRMWCVWRKGFRLARLGALAARNLDAYRKSHVFRVWKRFGERKRDDRKLCADALRRMGLSRTASSFYCWKMCALKMRRTRESGHYVMQSSRKSCLHRCWRTWRLEHRKTQIQKQQVTKVVDRWKSQRVHANFHCWKARWSLRKRHCLLLQKLQLLSKERVVEIHFQAWKRLCKTHANANRDSETAARVLQQWRLRRAVKQWSSKLMVTRMKGSQLRDALAHWQHIGLAAPFRRWVEFTTTRKSQRTQFAAVASFFRQGLTRTHFSRWKAWTRRRQTATTRLRDVRHHIQRQQMKRCVQALHLRAQLRRRFRCIGFQIARSSAQCSLQQSFAVWTRFMVARHAQASQQFKRSQVLELWRLRRAVRRWAKQARMRRLIQSTILKAAYLSKSALLQQCFRSWREYLGQRALRRSLMHKALVFQVFSILPLYLRAWKRHVDQQRRVRALLMRASGFMRHRLEHKAFAAWEAYATSKKTSLRVIARWKHATAVRCFAAWACFIRHEKSLRDRHEAAERVIGHHRARCTLRRWQQAARVQRILRVVSGQQAGRATAEVFARWRRFCRGQRAAKRLVGRLQNQTLVRVLNSWKQRVSLEAARRIAIRDRFAALWLADLRGECWACWKRFAQTRRLVRRLLVDRRDELTRNILTSWRCEARRRKWREQCASVIRVAAVTQAKRAFWTEWRLRSRVVACAKAMRGQTMLRRSSENVRWRFDRWLLFAQLGRCVRAQRRRIQMRLVRVVFLDGFAAFARARSQERALSLRIQETHRAFLRVWLSEQVHARVDRISAAEHLARKRAGHRLVRQTWSAWRAYHAHREQKRAMTERLRQQMHGFGGFRFDQAQAMMLRWSSLELARAMRQWRVQAFKHRRERRNALLALNWWMAMTTSRAFHGWKHAYASQKQRRVVQALYVRGATKRSFAKWTAWQQQRRAKAERTAAACALRINSLCRSVCGNWKLVTATRRTQRRLVLSFYRASCLRLLRALMLEWKTFAISSRTKRVQCTVARACYQERLLRMCVGVWKAQARQMTALRVQLQANTERLQVLMVCSCFRAWHAWSKQHGRLVRIMSALSTKCGVRTSGRVFAAWRGYVDAKVKHRCLADTFYRFRRYHKAIDALKAIRSQSHHCLLLMEKAHMFKTAMLGTKASNVFARWRKFTALARKTRAVTLQYLQGKLLPTYWRAWVEVVRRRRSLSLSARAIAATWTNILARRAWNALVAHRSYRQMRRERLVQGEAHYHTRQLSTAVRFWRASTEWEGHFASVCRSVIVRWQMATVCRCLTALRQFTSTQKRLERSAATLSLRSRQQHSLTTWCAWRKLFLVRQAGRRRNLAFYWRKWTAWRDGQQSLSLFQDRIHAVVLKSTQRQTFRSWREFVARRKMGKAMALLSSRFSDSLAAKRSFASWCAYVARMRANKAQMRAVVAHVQSRLAHAAFRSLAGYRDGRKSRRAASARSTAFHSRQVLCRVLNAWKAMVSARSAQRERLRRYVHLLQHAVQAKSFRSWADYSTHRRELRKRMARSIAMRTQLCLQTLLFEWRRYVARVKQSRRALDFQRAHLSARALSHWRQLVVLNKVQRMIGASTKRSLETCFVTWRKSVATSRRIRGFQLETQRKRHGAVLACGFQAWKQWSSVRARCKRILSRMANGTHLRVRFLLWREFAAQRRRLALLLQPASPPSAIESGKSPSLTDDGAIETRDGATESIAVLRAQLAAKARFFQQFEYGWDQRNVWRYWRLAFHAMLFHRLRTLQRHFLSWQHHSNRRKHARMVLATITGSRQRSSTRSVFTGWRDVVRRVKQLQAERQRERQLWTIVNTEMLRREKRQVRAHFVAWLTLIQNERHVQVSADAYHRARLVTKVWLAWRHDFHALAALARRRWREQRRQLRIHALARAVSAFRSNRSRRKRVRLAIEYCVNKRNDELVPRILSLWHKWTQSQRASAKHREYVQGERLRRVLYGWRSAADQQCRHREIVSMLIEQRAEQEYTRVWTIWRRFVRLKRHSRQLTECAVAFRVRLLLLSGWRKRSVASKSRRDRLQYATQQLAKLRVDRATRKWRSIVGRRELQRLYRSFVQRKFLSQWRMNVKLALATRFHEWTRQLATKRLLFEWRSTARRLALWRRLAASVSTLRLANSQRLVWRKWTAFVQSRRLVHLAVEFNERRLLFRCLGTWFDAAQSLIEEREARLEVAMDQLKDGVRRRVLAQWRARSQRSKQRRFVVLACMFKLDGFLQKRVLQAVLAAWRRQSRLARASHGMMLKRETRALRSHIGRWRAWVAARRARHLKQRGADCYYTQRLRSAAFFYWQSYALAWREADAESSPAPSAVAHSGLSRLSVGETMDGAIDSHEGVGSDDEEQHRRPMSPVMKRLANKQEARAGRSSKASMKTERKVTANSDTDASKADLDGDDGVTMGQSVTPSLADAAELSVGVRKRLKVLGPWHTKR